MPAFCKDKLLAVLKSYPEPLAYLVGFSGGADSTALLHAMVQLRDCLDIPLSAVHVNHGIHAQADDWQRFCETFCQLHEVPLKCLKISLDHQSGKGLEAEARHLRYEAMAACLKPGSALLTAHHADDQAETLLLNLMRGSGVDGLAAMPEQRPLGKGVLQRPLLGFENRDLVAYLAQHDIEWIDDPSNQHLNHDRNFIRHQLLPVLEQRWQNINKRLLLTRDALAGARILLERMADDFLEEHLLHPDVLKISPEFVNDPHLFKLVMRRWVMVAGAASIPAYRLAALQDQLAVSNSSQSIEMRWDRWTVRLYDKRLWLTCKQPPPCPLRSWPGDLGSLDLGPELGQLSFHKLDRPGSAASVDPAELARHGLPDDLTVTCRKHVVEKSLHIRGHHKSLKKLFQAAKIPHWLRDAVPLLQANGELLSVGDWDYSDQLRIRLRQGGHALRWRPNDSHLRYIVDSHREKP